MTLHLNFPHHRHHATSNATEQANEVREARRFLKERVRNDWEYATLPAWRSSGREKREEVEDVEDRIAGFRFHVPEREKGVLGLEFEPVEWRERGYSSCEEGESEEEVVVGKGGSTYKFEAPDSVSERRVARKRRRFVALEQEMEWNDGLAHWMRRRDAWCCARTATQVNFAGSSEDMATSETLQTTDSASASSSSPRSSTSSSIPQQPTSTPGSSPSTTPDLTALRATSTTQTIISPSEVLVPIAPPLLPNHPVRRKISPNMYPEIYTKIILQSRTPSVPINLKTLVHALVQGWKTDGEWPPKSVPLEKSIGRKRGSHSSGLREGVKAVGRVLRLTGTSEVGRGES
ncbi:hypothetical protein PRZ48_000612 [Zasmidium cellare]|uniref:Gag1-like clamp domain-containing protein n=1 Tax=Zasmidium cellare TaxID=395010 RepID=A0ABR0EZU8_ZASCE|nr:hypothetical protein PRZ48_000612 [Zasmidium cellare]